MTRSHGLAGAGRDADRGLEPRGDRRVCEAHRRGDPPRMAQRQRTGPYLAAYQMSPTSRITIPASTAGAKTPSLP